MGCLPFLQSQGFHQTFQELLKDGSSEKYESSSKKQAHITKVRFQIERNCQLTLRRWTKVWTTGPNYRGGTGKDCNLIGEHRHFIQKHAIFILNVLHIYLSRIKGFVQAHRKRASIGCPGVLDTKDFENKVMRSKMMVNKVILNIDECF